MSKTFYADLPDRGVVAVMGPDAAKFLQGLVTNDVAALKPAQAAHAALLSPQGKILFDFFAVRAGDGFLLDVARDLAPDLVKRLSLYKLRANVTIANVSDRFRVGAVWGDRPIEPHEGDHAVVFADPRLANLGYRILFQQGAASEALQADAVARDAAAYQEHRIGLGVPEGGKDYDFGDAYPHEADFDIYRGVSFTKGCYVGQEIVARMQHKTTVRKRVAKVSAEAVLPANRPEVMAGGVAIGRLGSVAGHHGLALIRLDRVAEFAQKGTPLTAGGVTIAVTEPATAQS